MRLFLSVILLSLAISPLRAAGSIPGWIGSWASSQQIPESHNALAPDDLRDATLRQIVHLSIGGQRLRVHISNAFGTAPLHFASVHIARPLSSAGANIDPATDKALSFGGKSDATVPAGAEYISDPVDYPVAPLSDLAITMYFAEPPAQQTSHPGSRATSYLVHGDKVSAADLPDAKRVDHWYQLSGVDVLAPAGAASIVILGDSITDGRASTTNGNDRWPDVLARRLQGSTGVLNHGIGGNHLLTDGLGPNALSRFDRDVLAQTGIRHLMVLEGVNDLGGLARKGNATQAEHAALVKSIVAAYEQIVARARAHGIQAIGCTILPYTGSDYYHPTPADEADRQAVNEWIRRPGHFDAVVDLDRTMRDPEHPERLLPAHDCGDHLHPSPAGYAAMAAAVPLSLFAPASQAPKIALTFDDLPEHSAMPPGESRLGIAKKIVAALRDAHVPPTYGLVNGAPLAQRPEEGAVLEAWRNAGNPIGNHGWSHMNLNQRGLDEYERDILRNEPVLQKWMPSGDWHWYRFPFLAEGDTPEKKTAIRTFLRERGYKIAGMTMGFGDYAWNEPYARCKAKGDKEAAATLEKSFLAAAADSIQYYRGLSQALYGRDIPYVLLMHIGALDAELLPQLLKLYQANGFQFVTLEEAESDPFYRADTDLTLPPGVTSLEGAMADRQLPLPARTNYLPAQNVCR